MKSHYVAWFPLAMVRACRGSCVKRINASKANALRMRIVPVKLA